MSGPIDCGSDMGCLADASESCKPAKASNSVRFGFMGVNQTTKVYNEIKGTEMGRCAIYSRIERIDLSFPAQTPADLVREQNALYDSFEGRDQTCYFEQGKLTSVLRDWDAGRFSSDDLDDAYCLGNIFDMDPDQSASAAPSDTGTTTVSLKDSPALAKNCPEGYSYVNGACREDEPVFECDGPSNYNIYNGQSVTFTKDGYPTVYDDYCRDSDTVTDYYCDGDQVTQISVDCPSGYSCSGGQCSRTYACSGSSSYGSLYSKTYRYVQRGADSYQYSDYCVDDHTVRKVYCNGDTASYGDVHCPSGYSCSNGACVWKPQSCSGPTWWSYYTKNRVYYENGDFEKTYSDSCVDSDTARKYYCSGNDYKSVAVNCPSGYYCSDGACLYKGPSGCSSASCGSSSSGSSSSSSSSGGCSGGSCDASKDPTTPSSEPKLSNEQIWAIANARNPVMNDNVLDYFKSQAQ